LTARVSAVNGYGGEQTSLTPFTNIIATDNLSTKHVTDTRRNTMSLGMILLIVLVLALLGTIPTWGHSRSWGYGPSGGIGLVLVIVVVLVMMGRI